MNSCRPPASDPGHDPANVGSTEIAEGQSDPAVGSSAGDGLGDFAPADLTDAREQFDWASRWDRSAWKQIAAECAYLFLVTLVATALIFFEWNGNLANWFNVSQKRTFTFSIFTMAWTGGLLGGTTFCLKWLYHTVAKGHWNRDRVVWRVFTPLISAALSLALVALIRSDILKIINSGPLSHRSGVLAFAFLAGYFSDNVIASMLRLAEKLFGPLKQREQ